MGSDRTAIPRFIGVDGCRDGWFCVAIDAAGDWSYALARDAAELADHIDGAASVLIDIKIGLREKPPAGRVCDHEARRLLGQGRASSVFSPPDLSYSRPIHSTSSNIRYFSRATVCARGERRVKCRKIQS